MAAHRKLDWSRVCRCAVEFHKCGESCSSRRPAVGLERLVKWSAAACTLCHRAAAAKRTGQVLSNLGVKTTPACRASTNIGRVSLETEPRLRRRRIVRHQYPDDENVSLHILRRAKESDLRAPHDRARE